MEALEAGTKKRVLPTWMTAQEVEKRTTQVKIPKRRRTAVVPAATARLPATRTVYCMNEAEIVDVALGILIEQDRKQEKPSERPPLAGADKPELSPASSAEDRSEDGDSGDIGLPPGSPPPGPASSDPACSGSPGEDQDALKYVREIFFS